MGNDSEHFLNADKISFIREATVQRERVNDLATNDSVTTRTNSTGNNNNNNNNDNADDNDYDNDKLAGRKANRQTGQNIVPLKWKEK